MENFEEEESKLGEGVQEILNTLALEIREIRDDFNAAVPYIRNGEKGINKTLQQNLYNSFFKTEIAPYCSGYGEDRRLKDDIDREVNARLASDPKGTKLIKKWDIYEEKLRAGGRLDEFLQHLVRDLVVGKSQHEASHPKFLAKATKRVVALFVLIRLKSQPQQINSIQELYDIIFNKNFLQRRKRATKKQPLSDTTPQQQQPQKEQVESSATEQQGNDPFALATNSQNTATYTGDLNEEHMRQQLHAQSENKTLLDSNLLLEELNELDLQDSASSLNGSIQLELSGNYYSHSFSRSYSNNSQLELHFVDRFFNVGTMNNQLETGQALGQKVPLQQQQQQHQQQQHQQQQQQLQHLQGQDKSTSEYSQVEDIDISNPFEDFAGLN